MNSKYLVYDNECRFCTNLANRVSKFVNNKQLVLVPKTVAIDTMADIHAKYNFNTNIHLIVAHRAINKDGYVDIREYTIFTAGSAIAETIAIKDGFGFISILNSFSVFKLFFNIFYKLLKLIRILYNRIKG